ncbi:MAG: hypothetical protein QM718_11180 [Steroidobacteraceae bacterium]
MNPSLFHLFQLIEATRVATAVRNSGWLFPSIETVHVLAIVLVVGTIAIVDLRILGLTSPQRSIGAVAREMLPFTWSSFAIAVITGSLLFMSSATSYAVNWPFRLKILLLLLAGGNMLLFHWQARGALLEAVDPAQTPRSWRVAGAISLLFWVGIVTAGRWIGFEL